MTTRQKKIKKLCQKFYDDLQDVFDEMSNAVEFSNPDWSEYECSACQQAVSAQSEAECVAEADADDWKD